MIKTTINISIASLLLISGAAFAANNLQLKCNNTVIDLGTKVETVISACGTPIQNYDKTDDGITYKKLKYKTYESENKIKTELKFVDNKLVDIEYSKSNAKYDL